MHSPFIRQGFYYFWVMENKRWVPRRLDLRAFPFTRATLLHPMKNIYFAAALLHIYEQQCPDIDSRFRSVPHRHFASHFIYGDQVTDAGSEDKILLARRRLLQYYYDKLPAPRGRYRKLKLYCPLDGPPRKITSGLGDVREGGRRAHRGVDFSSIEGEPVRAIADGWVTYAGVDLPARGARSVLPYQAYYVSKRSMGVGGLFVTIQHEGNLSSSYMHLLSYTVQKGQPVKAGSVIGYVGRTGIKVDVAHLHFELKVGEKHIDPIPQLRSFVIPPQNSFRGRYILAAQPKRWERAKARFHAAKPKQKRNLRRKRRKLNAAREEMVGQDHEEAKNPRN
jgi:murein DD-endopeptidase MepM/ murein hydrolase activator NlpD